MVLLARTAVHLSRFALLAAVAGLGWGCRDDDRFQYRWDDRRILCSSDIDDLIHDSSPQLAHDHIESAADNATVALLHTHTPGVTISMEALEYTLSSARDAKLEFVTYPELVEGPPRAALALSFDDSNVESWYSIKDLLASYGARVTFFVTEYLALTDLQKQEIAELAAAGHAVEAHSVNHLHARYYVKQHGVDGYLADEALPSIDVLEADGYAITSYAFPYGESMPALDYALLEHVQRVRVGPGSCPY
jgi:peptidoglycan/xylan/chitin deacetylase (PgdA/CDA1 family)